MIKHELPVPNLSSMSMSVSSCQSRNPAFRAKPMLAKISRPFLGWELFLMAYNRSRNGLYHNRVFAEEKLTGPGFKTLPLMICAKNASFSIGQELELSSFRGVVEPDFAKLAVRFQLFLFSANYPRKKARWAFCVCLSGMAISILQIAGRIRLFARKLQHMQIP